MHNLFPVNTVLAENSTRKDKISPVFLDIITEEYTQGGVQGLTGVLLCVNSGHYIYTCNIQ